MLEYLQRDGHIGGLVVEICSTATVLVASWEVVDAHTAVVAVYALVSEDSVQ